MFKPFDRYIFKEIASPFGIGLLVYTSTLLVDQILRLSNLLISKNVSLDNFFLIIVFTLPDLLSFTIPMANLMGILAGMSRMSSDSEIMALRTMGIGSGRIMKPIFSFSLLAFLSSFLLISFVVPEANYRRARLLFEVALSYNINNLKPGVFYQDIPQYTVYFKEIDNSGNWKNVLIYSQKNPDEDTLILAKEGLYLRDRQKNEGQIVLFDGVIHTFKKREPEKYSIAFFSSKYEPIAQLGPIIQTRRSSQMALPSLWKKVRLEPRDIFAQVEFHNKFALPFASLALGFLGLSLGISTKKGGKTSGLIISLGVVFIYYVLFTAARNLILKEIISPLVGMWAPNLFLMAVGLVLFFLLKQEKEIDWKKIVAFFARRKKSHPAQFKSTPEHSRGPLKILDFYVFRRITGLFFLILISLLLVFYLVSIIDLMDEVIENKVPLIVNLKYNYFMTPYSLTLVLPIAVLTSILLAFSLMSKNNEVIAVQVSGISLYRLTLPAILLGIIISAAVFGIQEKILPNSNQKAMEMLEILHKRKSVTEMEMAKYWLEGKQNRIYFYSYREKETDRFINFNILDFDEKFALKKRTMAQYARWVNTHELALSDVLAREYHNQIPTGMLQRSPDQNIVSAEERSSFFETVKFSTQMSITELKRYIVYLKKNKSATVRYEAQLYYNYAYPLSALIMALIAIPFSFLMGNRGTLFGIGIAVVISLVYWGALGIFSALGKTALLPPFISAFAPIILFSALFSALLFRVKT